MTIKKLLLLGAAGSMIVGMPAGYAEDSAWRHMQVASAATVTQPQPVPEWQVAAGGKMAFEVDSVKQTGPGTSLRSNIPLDVLDHYVPTGGLFSTDATLETYIEFAYKLYLSPEQREALRAHTPRQLVAQRFTITARAAGNPTKDQYRLMMQSLLADRFKIVVHFEERDMPVLALVLVKPGKLGPYLRATADGPPCNGPTLAAGAVAESMPSPILGIAGGWSKGWPYECGWQTIIPKPNNLILWGLRNSTIAILGAELVNMPPRNLGRPVVDETGLIGKFDFVLEWEYLSRSDRGLTTDAGAPPELYGPTLEDALEKQLGLKLKPARSLVNTLVLDHVEIPTQN